MLRELPPFNNIAKYGTIFNSVHIGFNEDFSKGKDPKSSIASSVSRI